jgi:hypothetical protein
MWVISCLVIVNYKLKEMYILRCFPNIYLKVLRKTTKNHQVENKICSLNHMECWVSSDVNNNGKECGRPG